jgi:hypothetical protein
VRQDLNGRLSSRVLTPVVTYTDGVLLDDQKER